MRDFTRLKVWRRAFDLAIRLEASIPCRSVRGIPGLRSQVLRAAASISANICEGCGKESVAELVRFLDIAIASTKELYNDMLMAREVGMLAPSIYAELEAEREAIIKMLFAFKRSMQGRVS